MGGDGIDKHDNQLHDVELVVVATAVRPLPPLSIRNATDFAASIQFGVTRESRVLEFKERFPFDIHSTTPLPPRKEPRFKLRKAVVSLANTSGGSLLVGVKEGDGPHYRVAKEPTAVVNEELLKWIGNTLHTNIFPVIDYDTDVLAIDHNGQQYQLLAINVRPLTDTIGCFTVTNDEIYCPYRDDFGVKYYRPLEVMRMLDSRIRRVRLLLEDLATIGMRVVVHSPVYHIGLESPEEQKARLRSAGHQQTTRSPPPRLHREYPYADCTVGLESFNASAIRLNIDSAKVVVVPLSLVRDVWMTEQNELALILDCDIVVPGRPAEHIYLRTR